MINFLKLYSITSGSAFRKLKVVAKESSLVVFAFRYIPQNLDNKPVGFISFRNYFYKVYRVAYFRND